MNWRPAFKSDESFLEKASIGATGTRHVFNDLSQHGHRPIELERGSMSFKIWKGVKIKRVRVPDILCIGCGKRVEPRAKTKLEITMSHSMSTAERGWDFGLGDDDYIAFVKCTKAGDRPIDWVAEDPAQYVRAGSMRNAYGSKLVFLEKPKGVTEGFEIRVMWPSAIAGQAGEITSVGQDKIKYRKTTDERTVTLSLSKKGLKLEPQVSIGDKVKKN